MSDGGGSIVGDQSKKKAQPPHTTRFGRSSREPRYYGRDNGEQSIPPRQTGSSVTVDSNENSTSVDEPFDGFAPPFPKKHMDEYPLLYMPRISNWHSGKIKLKRNKDSSLLQPKSISGIPTDIASECVGCQMYSTGIRELRRGQTIKGMASLKYIANDSFFLLHPSYKGKSSRNRAHMDNHIGLLLNCGLSGVSINTLVFASRTEVFMKRANVKHEDDKTCCKIPYDPLDQKVICTKKSAVLGNYIKTYEHARTTLLRVFSGQELDPTSLTSPAKMGVQLLAEILAYEVASGVGGYVKIGPILKSLIRKCPAMIGSFIAYPAIAIEGMTCQLNENEKALLQIGLGIQTRAWDYGVDVKKNLIQILEGSIIPITSKSKVSPSTLSVIEGARIGIRRMMFEFEHKNDNRDLASWFLLVTSFVRVSISDGNTAAPNAFEHINHANFAELANSTEGQVNLKKIIHSLAEIFWECYHWQWNKDIRPHLKKQGKTVSTSSPRTHTEIASTRDETYKPRSAVDNSGEQIL